MAIAMERAWQQYVSRSQWLQAKCSWTSLRNDECGQQCFERSHAWTRSMIPIGLTGFFHSSIKLSTIPSLCTQVSRIDRPSMLLQDMCCNATRHLPWMGGDCANNNAGRKPSIVERTWHDDFDSLKGSWRSCRRAVNLSSDTPELELHQVSLKSARLCLAIFCSGEIACKRHARRTQCPMTGISAHGLQVSCGPSMNILVPTCLQLGTTAV